MSEMRMRIGGQADQDEIREMCDLLRAAAAPILAPDADSIDPNQIAKMHAAAAVFSGILFGQLIAMGAATDGDKRRAAEGAATNFRTGIELGKRHVMYVAELLAGGIGNA